MLNHIVTSINSEVLFVGQC